MSILAGLTTDDQNIKQETDSVGGGGVLDSDIYMATITMAYLDKSKGGALSLNLHFKTDEGRESRQKLWITSGDAKGNKNYYEAKDGTRSFLPGFNVANSLCLLSLGKEISQLTTEQKVVKLYSFEAKAEVPTTVDVLVDLIGAEAYLAVQKQTVDKNIKSANGDYVPSGETRDVNEIDKVFRLRDKMTTTEIRAQAEEASFFDTWLNKFKGKVINKAKGAASGAASGAPTRAPLTGASSGGAAAPSLFG